MEPLEMEARSMEIVATRPASFKENVCVPVARPARFLQAHYACGMEEESIPSENNNGTASDVETSGHHPVINFLQPNTPSYQLPNVSLEHEALDQNQVKKADAPDPGTKSKKKNNKKGKEKQRKKGYEEKNKNAENNPHPKPEKKTGNNNVARIGRAHKGNKPIGSNGGDSSESDGEGRAKIMHGHYAGIETSMEKDASMKTVSDQPDLPTNGACFMPANKQPSGQNLSLPVEENSYVLLDEDKIAGQRQIARRRNKLESRYQWVIDLIKSEIVHCSYKKACACTGDRRCMTVRTFLSHFEKCSKRLCMQCEVTDIATCMHSLDCDNDRCEVAKCQDFKKLVGVTAHEKRNIQSVVLQTTSTLFKKGQYLNQDVDYVFLYDKPISKGKFGEVISVWFYHPKKEIEAAIAVKKVKYDLAQEAMIHEYLREDHPNILGAMCIIAFKKGMKIGNQVFRGYIFMEKADFTLFDLKKSYEKGVIPLMDAIYFFAQIIDGLAYVHSKNIVHKDIKDLNVLMTESGQRAKISDWDAAVLVEGEMTGVLDPKGTEGFAAPEVVAKQPHSTAADIYSAGVTFLEISCGGQYYNRAGGNKETKSSYDDRRKAKLEELKELSQHVPGLYDLIVQCLEPDPSKRPTALELKGNPILTLESTYKVPIPQKIVPPKASLLGNVTDLIYFDHCSGRSGEELRSKAETLEDQDEAKILSLMDQLPKNLPTENIPVSNDWVESSCAPVEDMDCT